MRFTNRFEVVVVIDQNDEPVGAWIMQGGRAEERIINGDGTFTFTLEDLVGAFRYWLRQNRVTEPSAWNAIRVSR